MDSLQRYHRQTLLSDFGVDAQRRLSGSTAVIVGCGALGTVVSESLCRAGIGRLVIIDRDLVELTNLQRQTLFDESDARENIPKALAAAKRLASINSQIQIVPIIVDVSPRNIEAHLGLVGETDRHPNVIIDGTDNFSARYLINDVCVKHQIPLVYGGVVGTSGVTMTITPGKACLRCVFPDRPVLGSSPTCDTVGVLGPMVGVVASIQAAEAMKILLGRLDLLRPIFSSFDIWKNTRRTIDLSEIDRSLCPCCGKRSFEFLHARDVPEPVLCGTDAVQVFPAESAGRQSIDLASVAERLKHMPGFKSSIHLLRMPLQSPFAGELVVFADGRAIVKGTRDVAQARSVYARYVGS